MIDIRNVKTISIEEYDDLINQSLELKKLNTKKTVSYKRHVVKAISYRVLGSLQTCTISYFFTGNFWVAGSIGITEICIKPIIYFFHERAWYKWIKYGLTNKK
jgi:uncharacterized membrane protein